MKTIERGTGGGKVSAQSIGHGGEGNARRCFLPVVERRTIVSNEGWNEKRNECEREETGARARTKLSNKSAAITGGFNRTCNQMRERGRGHIGN